MTEVARLFLYLAPTTGDDGDGEERSDGRRGVGRVRARAKSIDVSGEPSDAELIEAIRTDDAGAFTSLMVRYADALARYAGRLIGTQGVADELVQDAFFSVWQQRKTVEIRSSPKAFLYGVVRNICYNWRRRERLELLHISVAERTELGDAKGMGEADELETDVFDIIRSLPPRAREVMTLRLRDELTYPEIAAVLGIAQKTVESHVTVALRTLRQELRRRGWGTT